MNLIIWICYSIAIHSAMFWYLARFHKDMTEDKKKLAWFIPTVTLLFVLLEWYISPGLSSINLMKVVILYGIVIAAGIVDLKKKIIPNELIMAGLVGRLMIYALEWIFVRDEFTKILLNDGAGLLIGVVLLLISLVSRQGIGFGDVKLFMIIGLFLGLFGSYSILFVSVILCAVIGLVLLACKKKKRKDTICFGPFIALGYLLVLVLGSF